MRNFTILFLVVLCTTMTAFGQVRTVSGSVTDGATDEPLPGVSVIIKGTASGATTDINGQYALEVDENAVLVFSFIGFVTKEVAVNDQSTINVNMDVDILSLNEVVITAMGFTREKKSLTYAAQELDSEDLTASKDPSFINALSGKAAGIFVNRSASGIGGSSRVILRGNSSTRDNNVLYVIDGVPMNNVTPSQPTDVWGQAGGIVSASGRDGGDGISNLNPEDIQSISVLKGASAAALYGSQASNGVILITTKKGIAGKPQINFSSNYTAESILLGPELQFDYGQTAEGSIDSWGSKVNADNHVEDFFQTGQTWINSVSLSGGNEMAQTYFSYANTNSKGILPGTEFKKHNLNLKETGSFYNDKLKVSGNVNLIVQEAENRPASGLYFNPLTGLYHFPRGLDFDNYKENYEVFSPERNTYVQNWTISKDDQQNPYWIINRNQNFDNRKRSIINATASYQLTEELSIQSRGTMDRSFDVFDQRSYASTQSTIADANGRYLLQETEAIQYYGDAILSFNKQFGEQFSVSANLGTSINDTRLKTNLFDSYRAGGGSGLQYANVFNIQNIAQPGATFAQIGNRSQLQSVFGSLNVGFNGMIYADVTARNDWSSTLAFTDNQSFLYPSVGLTAIVSEMVTLPAFIDFLKVRGSYAQVGNGVNAFDTNVLYQITPAGAVAPIARVPEGTELKPETNISNEFGIELQLFKNRVTADLTVYSSTTKDQRISINAPSGAGVSQHIINAGEIMNKGIELGLGFTPVRTPDFTWTGFVNFTKNTNTVKSLSEDLADGIFYLTQPGVNNYAMAIREGGSFGEIYGKKFQRDSDGNILVNADGAPLASAEGLELVGDINPDFLLGFSNSLQYKNFSLNFLIDGRFGGEVMDITQAMIDELGVSQVTADARNEGGVDIGAVTEGGQSFGKIDAQIFYQGVGGRAGITEHYTYDATNIRLRELSLGFSLPSALMGSLGPLKKATISIVGRNLFFLMVDAPFDPDLSMSTGTGLQGVNVFSLPSTRSLGFNISLSL